jgi:DNA repair protein RadC
VTETETDIRAWPLGDLLAAVVGAPSPRADLVEHAGGLERLATADAFEIAAWVEARDPDRVRRASRASPRRASLAKARALSAAFELGRRLEIARAGPQRRLASASEVAAWATPRLSSLTHEELWMIALDGRGHMRAARCVARGGLHGAAVRAADLLRAALRADASAFVLVHNHPSGDPTPSREDVALTTRVAAAAAVVGVVLLDHVVVARSGFACVPEQGAEASR